jgi:hypothetical protein
MSGFGAPFFDRERQPQPGRSVALFGSIFPVLSASGNGARKRSDDVQRLAGRHVFSRADAVP